MPINVVAASTPITEEHRSPDSFSIHLTIMFKERGR